jgi:hypothetical protein
VEPAATSNKALRFQATPSVLRSATTGVGTEIVVAKLGNAATCSTERASIDFSSSM